MVSNSSDLFQQESLIRSAFLDDKELCDRVLNLAKQDHHQWLLLVDIASYIQARNPIASSNGSDPSSKKRKFESNGTTPSTNIGTSTGTSTSAHQLSETIILPAVDAAFTIPFRKKLSVSVRDSNGSLHGGVHISVTGTDGNQVYELPWDSIEYAFAVAVPEKVAPQTYFVILLRSDAGIGEKQWVWSLPDRKAGEGSNTGAGPEDGNARGDSQTWIALLSSRLSAASNRLVVPSEDEFASTIVQSHRKGEKAYHVKAHVKSKEGYLFFLSTGILFGFKKPILFYPFHEITSISYTSVLQRTFNLVLSTEASQGEGPTDVEFSMLDQADFSGIDAYVKYHGLNDASMASERRAKKYNVDKKKEEVKSESNGVDGEGQDMEEVETELAKAERQLQDEEDEQEEDYDPGSEGESEGEGGSSEEEGDGQIEG